MPLPTENQALLQFYADAAVEHERAMQANDYRRANKAHDKVLCAYTALKRRGPKAVAMLTPFLAHESRGVRVWAAAHLLSVAPQEAESCLAAVADGTDLSAFDARITLSEWRKGTLRMATLED